jgi:predicted dehydrogenase
LFENPLKIALVGCGQIADAHLGEIRKISGAQLVGVCDRAEPLAHQAASRFGVPRTFTSIEEMSAAVHPDVVHITTPPQSHRAIAEAAFAAGAHVYIEKPFAIDAAEAQQIVVAAAAAGRKVCVGHDQLFDPVWLRCRQLQQEGKLGEIAHIESIQGYDLSGPFGAALAAEPDHWVHRLPGGLFQNVISHALYRITEFMTDQSPQIRAIWRDLRGGGFPTDLRVILWGKSVSANLVFTSQARPVQRMARIFGSRRIIEVDLEGQVIRHHPGDALPGALAKIQAPARQFVEAGRNLALSLERFARSDIHYFAGMRNLFERFYASIRENTPPPIAADEIVRVTAIMDAIFAACREDHLTEAAGGVH